MARHTETVMVKDGGRERAVKVTIDAPNPETLDVQHLAQMAWFQPRKKIKAGDVTVTVQKFKR